MASGQQQSETPPCRHAFPANACLESPGKVIRQMTRVTGITVEKSSRRALTSTVAPLKLMTSEGALRSSSMSSGEFTRISHPDEVTRDGTLNAKLRYYSNAIEKRCPDRPTQRTHLVVPFPQRAVVSTNNISPGIDIREDEVVRANGRDVAEL